MEHGGNTAVAIVFWIFIGVVSVGGMILDYRKRKLALESIRLVIERGQQLSPEVIDRLWARDDEKTDPHDLQIGGIITCASGVGFALLSGVAALLFPLQHWVLIGVGVGILGICVGVGLLIAAKSLRR
jgi:Domain of unknown function (DUF6249)